MIENSKLSLSVLPKKIIRNDDSDKFLFESDKTVGFRKDKKLYKFVGIRDGYDKQFELTYKSIKIDNVEKISANRQNFTNLIEQDDIIHNINDLNIHSKITEYKLQNFVKIDSTFTDLEIIYEVHLKGLSYLKNDNKYDIIDSDNNIVMTIDEPIVIDVNNNELNIVEHELYMENDKLYYKKFIKNNTIENYPIYVDISVTYDWSNFGTIKSSNTLSSLLPASSRWNNALIGNTSVRTSWNLDIGYYLPVTVNECYVKRFYILFNTTVISSDYEVVSAKLKFNVLTLNNSLVVHQGTADNLSQITWNSFNTEIITNGHIEQTGPVALDVKNYINKGNYSSFYIRLYEYDHLGNIPNSIDAAIQNLLEDYEFYLEIEYKPISDAKTFKYNIEENGTNILSSTATSYVNCLNGSNVVVLNHNTNSDDAISFIKMGTNYTINRSYLNFDTSNLEIYYTDTVKYVYLGLSIKANTNISKISILKGEQSGETTLVASDWSKIGRNLKDVTLTTGVATNIIIKLDRSCLNFYGFTKFAILSTEYDLNQLGVNVVNDYDIQTGIEIYDSYLEIGIRSHTLYGQTYKKVEYNKNFNLSAYSNLDGGLIKWYSDKTFITEIARGSEITLNSRYMYDYNILNIYAILSSSSIISDTFNIDTGFNGTPSSIIQDSNSKYVFVGGFTTYNGLTQTRICKLNKDGSIDSAFDIGNGFNAGANSIIQDSNGKYVIVGNFTTYKGLTQTRICRLNQDGSLDATFVVGTGFNITVYSIIQDTNGKYIIGGIFTTYKGITQNRIIRLNQDGSLDSTFAVGTGFDYTVYSIIQDSNGKYVIGGGFANYKGITQNRIIRLNQDGSLDSTFVVGTAFNNSVNSIIQDSNGKYVIGGNFTTYKGLTQNRICRLNQDGSLDSTFVVGTGFNNLPYSIIQDSNGKYIIGGYFTTYKGLTQNYICRLNQNGSLDSTFAVGSGFDSSVNSIIQDLDKNYVITGDFTIFNNINMKRICVLNDSVTKLVSNQVLSVTLDIFNYQYEELPVKETNIIPMSLDNVYFKNYSCLNGICYTYTRNTENLYEENLYVSDGIEIGSYNLYSEYDIIDEFYTNLYEVDVAMGENINITGVYNKLDGVKLIENSRILLYKQTNPDENGIYTVIHNGTLIKTDELTSEIGSYRAKVNVNAGTNLDTEFHVNN